MVTVGVLFDLFPFLLILIAIIIVFSIAGGDLETVADAAKGETIAKVKVARSIGSAGVAGFFIAPIIYVAGSYIGLFLGYIFFTFWFMFKGVYMWSFSNSKRVIVNIISIAVESIPLLNLLPGITLMVLRHVKISQAEDKLKETEQHLMIQKSLARTKGV